MNRPRSLLFSIQALLILSGCMQSACMTKTLPHQSNLSSNPQVTAGYKIEPEKDISTLLNKAISFCHKAQIHRIEGDLDSAIGALDNAYAAILMINPEHMPQIHQQKENLRNMISKRILEIQASRNKTEIGSHNVIPIVMNSRVKAEIKLLTKGGENSFFNEAFKRSGRYRPLIVKALKEAGLPEELSWLPLIESGFKVDALSHARALGLWQFIPSTGYKFGLKRDYYIDERLDPVKSTKAATAYLVELHDLFGDWSTALAAYNCGEKMVLRLIQEQHISYLDNFWDLYDRLPIETQRYVARFIATLHIVNHPKTYKLNTLVIDDPLNYDTVSISKQVSLKAISKKMGISEQTMNRLNPELRYGILPGSAYPLRIPKNTKHLLLTSLDNIPISPSVTDNFLYHRIKHGETLSTIARHYHTSMADIALINNIEKNSYIVVGKVLKIPQDKNLTYRPTNKTKMLANAS